MTRVEILDKLRGLIDYYERQAGESGADLVDDLAFLVEEAR